MNKKIIALFSILFLTIVFIGLFQLSKPIEIDHLESICDPIINLVPESKIYYYSNSDSKELYFKTQFALAPKILINEPEQDSINESDYLLFLYDKSLEYNYLPNNVISTSKTEYTSENKWFKISLLKK